MTELNKVIGLLNKVIGVIGLLYFHKEILPSHAAEFPISCGWISLSKTSVCLEEYNLLYKRKRDWYSDTKCDDKKFIQLK